MQICTTTTVTVHICTVTITLPFNILVFVSLSSPYLLLSPHSLFLISSYQLSQTHSSLFLSSHKSFFLKLPSIAGRHSRRSPSPPFSLSSSFFLCFSLFSSWMGLISGFQVEWGWSMGFSLFDHWSLAFVFRCCTMGGRRRQSCCSGQGIDLDKWVLIHFLFY